MLPTDETGQYAEFGATIKERRLELSMTQEQVAEQVGVKPNYIGYLERGLRKPSDEICCRIADVLGLDQKELFFMANPNVREILHPREQPEQMESCVARYQTRHWKRNSRSVNAPTGQMSMTFPE